MKESNARRYHLVRHMAEKEEARATAAAEKDGARARAKQEKAALEKEEKQKKRLAKQIEELELGEALRDDESYPMLPLIMRKDLEVCTRDLQTIHDSVDIVKDDGEGFIPTMESVQETLKAAREVKTHINEMFEIIRQSKCLQ
mgnify:CR=1 FL=1